MAEQSNTPQLRFQGYTDAWGQERLGEMLVKNDERNKDVAFDNVESVSNKTGFTKQTEQFDDYSVASADLSNYYVIRERQFAYNPSRINVGSIAYKEKGAEIGVVSPLYISFSTKEMLDDRFLWYWFKTYSFDYQRHTLSEGGVRDTLSFDKIAQMEIKLPGLKEQQEIGRVLHSVDSLLSLHRRKREKLQEIKKSLLQKMFPAEGEDRPQIRFAGYTDAWGQERLGDIADRFDNLRVPVEAAKRVPGPVPYYGANGIQDYVSGYTHDGEYILVAEDGASDLVNYPVQYVSGKIWVNNHAHVLQGKEKVASTKFLKYLITRADVGSLLVGGSRAKLNAETMMNMDVRLPEDYQEQVDIGSLLFGVDDLLSLHQRKLYKLQEIKKALLQKMFC